MISSSICILSMSNFQHHTLVITHYNNYCKLFSVLHHPGSIIKVKEDYLVPYHFDVFRVSG